MKNTTNPTGRQSAIARKATAVLALVLTAGLVVGTSSAAEAKRLSVTVESSRSPVDKDGCTRSTVKTTVVGEHRTRVTKVIRIRCVAPAPASWPAS